MIIGIFLLVCKKSFFEIVIAYDLLNFLYYILYIFRLIFIVFGE